MLTLVPRDTLIGILVAPTIWALWLAISYSVSGLGCGLGWDQERLLGFNALRGSLLLVATFGAAAVLYASWQSWTHWRSAQSGTPDQLDRESRERRSFLSLAGLFLCGISLLGVLWGALNVLVVPPC